MEISTLVFHRKKALLACLLCLLTSSVCAQKTGYEKAYVITNDNDTIYGQVKLGTDKSNSLECNFYNPATNETRTYRPGEIAAYRFADIGKFYISHPINVKGEPSLVFLEYLVQGGLTLYYYRTTMNTYYFLEDADKRMVVMDDKKVEGLFDGFDSKFYSGKNQKYKGITSYMMNDWDEAAQRVKNLKLNHSGMVEIVSAYNEAVCTDDTCIVYSSNNPTPLKIRGAVFAGMSKHIPFKANNALESVGQFGAQIEFNSPRFSKSLSLVAEVSFLTWSKTYVFEGEKLEADASAIELRVMGRYTYTRGFLQPFAEIGVLSAYKLNVADNAYKSLFDLSTKYSPVLGGGVQCRLYKNLGLFVGAFWNVSHTDQWGIRGGFVF